MKRQPSPIRLRGRKFKQGEDEVYTGDLQRRTDILAIGLAQNQISVYNQLKSTGFGDRINAGIAFFGTTPAHSLEPVLAARTEGGELEQNPREAEFSTIEVPVYENIEEKLRILSERIRSAQEEYNRTGSTEAVLRYGRLSQEFELIATAKVKTKVTSKVPSIALQQDRLQREIERMLDRGDMEPMPFIAEADYKVTALQFEREFNNNVEGALSTVLDKIHEAEIDNMQIAGRTIAGETLPDEYQVKEAVKLFANLPVSSRTDVMSRLAVSMESAVANSQFVQRQIAPFADRSGRLERLSKLGLLKTTKRTGIPLVAALQHVCTSYEWSDSNDVSKSVDPTSVTNHVMRVLADGVMESIGDYGKATLGLFHAASYDVNVSRVGLLLADRQKQQWDARNILLGAADILYGRWNGDHGTLEKSAGDFALRYISSRGKLPPMSVATFDTGALDTKEYRKQIFDAMREEIKRIVIDPAVEDVRGKFLKKVRVL